MYVWCVYVYPLVFLALKPAYIVTVDIVAHTVDTIVKPQLNQPMLSLYNNQAPPKPTHIVTVARNKKKTETITLEEEDIAKLRYETVYLTELQSKQKLTVNTLIKQFRRKDFSKLAVSSIF